MEIYTDDLRKQLADKVSEIQKRDGVSLYELSEELYGDKDRLKEVFDSFDSIKNLQNELARMTPEEMTIDYEL